jgi:hypothetical protein
MAIQSWLSFIPSILLIVGVVVWTITHRRHEVVKLAGTEEAAEREIQAALVRSMRVYCTTFRCGGCAEAQCAKGCIEFSLDSVQFDADNADVSTHRAPRRLVCIAS